MDKEDIKRLAQNPDFIPGIYNYCDRWCERCPFCSRCMNYALSEDQFSDPEAQDIRNDKFWKKLHEIFQVTFDMLEEIAEKEGIDLDSIDLEQTAEEERRIDETANDHECCRAAKTYVEMVDSWFDSAAGLFEEKGNELSLKVQLQIPNTDPEGEAISLKDAVDVIRWYQRQMYVKLVRAVRGQLEYEPEIEDGFPKDSDGSAKVALIGTDRSIAAWGEMRTHFPDQEDEILDLLVHLDRLRRTTEKTFPEARAFVRPGFDEEKVRFAGPLPTWNDSSLPENTKGECPAH